MNSAPSLTQGTSGGAKVTYSITGKLPQGLSFNSSSGVISGTPTVTQYPASQHKYTVTATNSGGTYPTTLSIAVIDKAIGAIRYPTSSATSSAVGWVLDGSTYEFTQGKAADLVATPTGMPHVYVHRCHDHAVAWPWSSVHKCMVRRHAELVLWCRWGSQCMHSEAGIACWSINQCFVQDHRHSNSSADKCHHFHSVSNQCGPQPRSGYHTEGEGGVAGAQCELQPSRLCVCGGQQHHRLRAYSEGWEYFIRQRHSVCSVTFIALRALTG